MLNVSAGMMSVSAVAGTQTRGSRREEGEGGGKEREEEKDDRHPSCADLPVTRLIEFIGAWL